MVPEAKVQVWEEFERPKAVKEKSVFRSPVNLCLLHRRNTEYPVDDPRHRGALLCQLKGILFLSEGHMNKAISDTSS